MKKARETLPNSGEQKKADKAIFILCYAFIAGILLSLKLWVNDHNFPSLPILPGSNLLPFPFDYILTGAFLLLLAVLPFIKKKKPVSVAAFLMMLLLFTGDQNRLQPWAFQYAIMFSCVTLIYQFKKEKAAVFNDALCWIITGIYLWSGLQKFNENYFTDTAYWLMEPVDTLLGFEAKTTGKIAWIIPPLEVLLAIGLLFKRTTRASVWFLIVMHLFIMVDMGLLRSYNHVIQPWNLAMVLLLLLLLYGRSELPLFSRRKQILQNRYLAMVFLVFWILPSLSLINLWDSYLSSRLYSGNSSNGYVFISDKVRQKLPEYLKKQVLEKDGNPYVYINNWSMEELSVPCYPERRIYKKARDVFYTYTDDKSEIILLITDQFNLLDTTDVEIIK